MGTETIGNLNDLFFLSLGVVFKKNPRVWKIVQAFQKQLDRSLCEIESCVWKKRQGKAREIKGRESQGEGMDSIAGGECNKDSGFGSPSERSVSPDCCGVRWGLWVGDTKDREEFPAYPASSSCPVRAHAPVTRSVVSRDRDKKRP